LYIEKNDILTALANNSLIENIGLRKKFLRIFLVDNFRIA